jgi:hypothetical protein
MLMPRQHLVKQETSGWHLNLNWLFKPTRIGAIRAMASLVSLSVIGSLNPPGLIIQGSAAPAPDLKFPSLSGKTGQVKPGRCIFLQAAAG